MLQSPDGPWVVPRRVSNHLRWNLLQLGNEILELRVVVLQLTLGRGDHARPVRLELVALLTDVPEVAYREWQIMQEPPRLFLARPAVGSGELALQGPVVPVDPIGVGLRSDVSASCRSASVISPARWISISLPTFPTCTVHPSWNTRSCRRFTYLA